MKKRLFLMLAIVLMGVLILPLGVSANEEVEKYIPKIKEIFDIGDEYGELNIHSHNHRGKTIYNISWMNGGNNINVEIDLEGNILNYSNYISNGEEEHSRFPKITKQEALKKAKEMIAKIDSNIIEKIEYEDTKILGNINNYYFIFSRKENDIPFDYNSISVEVNNSTGQIVNLNLNWDKNIELPNKDNIINQESAYELYKKGQDVELIYMLNNKDNKLEEKLLYTIKDKNKAIDAKTGNAIENLSNTNNYIYGLFEDRKKVSVEDEKVLIDSKEIINKNDAEKQLRQFANLDNSYTISNSNLMRNALDGSYVWDIKIQKQEGNSGYGTTVSVNAQTKEVINFNTLNNKKNEEIKYTEDEALDKAKSFLKEKMPDKYTQVEYSGSMMHQYEENIKSYYFTFNRVIDKVKVPQNGFSLTISSITGEITNYNYMWNNIKIPSTQEIIEKEKAQDILLNNQKLKLNYIMDKTSLKNKKKEIKLVYNLDSKEGSFIDAKTGKRINSKDLFTFNYIDDQKSEYKDIDKSYANEEIKKLIENGIYLPGENFYPQNNIIQKDFLYLLKSTKGYIVPYNEEYIYDRFSREDIIKAEEKQPDKTITRGEAIKYIVRSFGQEKSAKLGDIYKSEYKDIDSISKELKGYIAVAEGLGLISGKGNFRANDNLTREEAAILIYNILNR